MAQVHKLESNLEIKSSACQMHDIWSNKIHLLSTLCPEKVKSIELLEGEWGREGCVIFWNFIHDGQPAVAKEVMEVIDKENKKIVFKVIGGDILDIYKSLKWVFEASPNGNSVRWTVEYEKDSEDVPEPYPFLDFAIVFNQRFDAYLTQTQNLDKDSL